MASRVSQPAPYESELQRTPELPESMRVLARIEDLLGQEDALLRIPAAERTRDQHDRLRAIGAELDRVVEKLRSREPDRPEEETSA
jgi:hypothetical protein